MTKMKAIAYRVTHADGGTHIHEVKASSINAGFVKVAASEADSANELASIEFWMVKS